VVTAVRSEQLTICRVRYGPELYGKIIRIDDDPRHCSWVRPPERATRVVTATSDGRVSVWGQRYGDLYAIAARSVISRIVGVDLPLTSAILVVDS
jgi:hypothetical protein